MSAVAQITLEEFLKLFQRCRPPGGWPRRIAVANSAGPDSSCLLYLMSSLVQRADKALGLPSEVWSIHVDHDLQPINSTMAQSAASTADKLGVPHRATKIPWGQAPFPKKPWNGPTEERARAARQNCLLNSLLQIQAPCIALGHHADDQLETAIMRLTHGSSKIGMAGMRPVRRWGMGDSAEPLSIAGLAGMNHWMIRPLLTVPKDRILATCEANNIEYVTDKTNFIPALALRNSIRNKVSTAERLSRFMENPPLTVWEEQIQRAVNTVSEYAHWDCSLNGLRQSLLHASNWVDQIERQVTGILDKCILPSPPSTVLLSRPHLLSINDYSVRIALIQRVLRCVSPRPWGSPSAVARGNRDKLFRIVRLIWDPPETDTATASSIASRVRWQLVGIRTDGAIRVGRTPLPGEYAAWLVTREPGWTTRRLMSKNEPGDGIVDYTDQILDAKDRGVPTLQLLHDGRFCIEIAVNDMHQDVSQSLIDRDFPGRILVVADTEWSLPMVVWRRDTLQDQILAQYVWAGDPGYRWTLDGITLEHVTVPWIQVSFIRPLSEL